MSGIILLRPAHPESHGPNGLELGRWEAKARELKKHIAMSRAEYQKYHLQRGRWYSPAGDKNDSAGDKDDRALRCLP
jgi:hypothetical protein